MMITTSTRISTFECWVCGVPFGLSATIEKRRRGDGKIFWCSANGCRLAFGEGEVARLKREKDEAIARLRSQVDRERTGKEAARRQVSALKGVVTKTKKRIGKGVCPCCNRTFANVARHMKSKHPEVVESEGNDGL